MPQIRLLGIHKTYKSAGRATSAIKGVSLEIESGDFVAIIGASGHGKSTLLNILGCLDQPDRGEYWIGEERVSWSNQQQLSRIRGSVVSTIFQDFELVPHWNVLENVSMPLRFHNVGIAESNLKAMQVLQRVGLLSQADKFPHELSGGEQQRCGIARALCSAPSIILADEPTGNLDPATGESIMGILKSFQAKGVTLIVVTHDMAVAQMANHIVRINQGRVERVERESCSTSV